MAATELHLQFLEVALPMLAAVAALVAVVVNHSRTAEPVAAAQAMLLEQRVEMAPLIQAAVVVPVLEAAVRAQAAQAARAS